MIMTMEEIKEYIKEEVMFQREVQIANGDKIYKGFNKEIKEMTIEALHSEGKITDKQYVSLMKSVK